jgi:GNAT superfamily N-acetyltransferase
MLHNGLREESASAVAAETGDAFSRHAEELVRARYAPQIADRGFTWPATGITAEDYPDKEKIVARIGGVVVGRAILEAVLYPLAELVNLEVHPPYRGRGVGSAIVRHAVETAARAGFLAIHAQTFFGNPTAERVYARHGFLPATRGDGLRIWQFLNLPALAQFLYDHPMALFESAPGAAPREHILRWRQPWGDRPGQSAGEDELSVTLTGGSCQRDSDGLGPGVGALRLRSGRIHIAAKLDATPEARIGGSFTAHLAFANESDEEMTGGFRLGLNPGFRIASDHPGGERFSLSTGASLERTLTIEIEPSFPADPLRICSYPSVPITAEFLLGDHTFWLAAQVRITDEARKRGDHGNPLQSKKSKIRPEGKCL